MTDSDREEPITDVAEPHQAVQPGTDEPDEADEADEAELPAGVPLEVDTADAAEQAREIALDEDDYR
jgi:hypothetical protein